MEIIEAQLNAAPPSLHALDPKIPPIFDELMEIALAKYQDERFPDATAMAAALEQAARELPP